MSAELLSAKIVIQEEEPKIRSIVGVPTAVTAFVGVTERGPLPNDDVPTLSGTAPSGVTRVTSFDEYQRWYGGQIVTRALPTAVRGFFLEGGTVAYIVRVVHYTDVTDATTGTAAYGTVTLQDSVPGNAVTVSGKSQGAYANSLSILIADATDGVATHFNLSVLKSGIVVETYPNLSNTSTDERFVGKVIGDEWDETNPSNLIRTTSPGTGRPVNGTFSLVSGDDGLTSLADADFLGGVSGTGPNTGMRLLDNIEGIRLLAVPGEATSGVHNGMLSYCETTRDMSMFAVLDPPGNATTPEAMVTYVNTTASLKQASEFGAIYWPYIKIVNPFPSDVLDLDAIPFPPSGHICGVFARTDQLQGGVSEAPAGVEIGRIRTAIGVQRTAVNDERKRDLLFPELINPIVNPAGLPVHIDGARTLKSTGNFPTIGERRLAIFVEQSIKTGLLFGKHRKIKQSLLSQFTRASRTFLITLTREGHFASDEPAKAFFVDFGTGLNTAITAANRTTIGRIGLATAKPNEFTVLFFSQDQRSLEEAIQLGV